jgi:hypothetical protein
LSEDFPRPFYEILNSLTGRLLRNPEFKVLYVVVGSIAVLVMDVFTIIKRSAKVISHHLPVLVDIPVLDGVWVCRLVASYISTLQDVPLLAVIAPAKLRFERIAVPLPRRIVLMAPSAPNRLSLATFYRAGLSWTINQAKERPPSEWVAMRSPAVVMPLAP